MTVIHERSEDDLMHVREGQSDDGRALVPPRRTADYVFRPVCQRTTSSVMEPELALLYNRICARFCTTSFRVSIASRSVSS
jgi:hypothetical protein